MIASNLCSKVFWGLIGVVLTLSRWPMLRNSYRATTADVQSIADSYPDISITVTWRLH